MERRRHDTTVNAYEEVRRQNLVKNIAVMDDLNLAVPRETRAQAAGAVVVANVATRARKRSKNVDKTVTGKDFDTASESDEDDVRDICRKAHKAHAPRGMCGWCSL